MSGMRADRGGLCAGRREAGDRDDLAGGEALTINYAVPNRNQCKECHSKDRELMPIGPTARNLNHVGPAGVQQLADWTERGILTGAPADAPAAPAAFGDGPMEDAGARVARHQLRALPSRGRQRVEFRAVPGVERDQSDGLGRPQAADGGGSGSGDNLFVIEPGKPDDPSSRIASHRWSLA